MKNEDFNAMIVNLETVLKELKEKYVTIDPNSDKSTCSLKIKIKILITEYFLNVAKKINKIDAQVTKRLIESHKDRIEELEDDLDQLKSTLNECVKFDNNGRIYISGPISGHNLEERRKAFKEVQSMLECQGYDVINPMENGLPAEATTHEHMKRDIELIMTCDYIYMMRRWTHSKGCKVEFDVATAIGLPVFFEESGEIIEFE